MKVPFFQVDAFTNRVFGGNPAAVCLMDAWLSDEVMQQIAAENNLSETAFLVQQSQGYYDLRWFTPTIEVDLCGHATLASAFVIFSFFENDLSFVEFATASGLLKVSRSNDLLTMDFPSRKPSPCPEPAILSQALGAKPLEILKSRDLLAVFPDEAAIRGMAPDFDKLKQVREAFAVIVTAPGDRSDFVSRFFAPNAGIAEDPVTGSAHCTLIPYWADRLGKSKLHALQLSKRGGDLICENAGDRVNISGRAVLYARGDIFL